jgi:DNA invertase Pin-like site-specific DNA recombinase
MLVGYARVSTDLQTTDGQIDALSAAGCERVFEESMSGTRADRPQLAAALEFAREGDVLVVARLDRLARSMRQLLTTVDALTARGIGLRSLHENIDTTSATGRLILHIFAALGQFEVELLRERTRTGLAASPRPCAWKSLRPGVVPPPAVSGFHHSASGRRGFRPV